MRTYLRRVCACVTVTLIAVAAAACFPTSDPSNTGGCTGTGYTTYTGDHTRSENGLVLDHLRIDGEMILTGDHQQLTNSCIVGNGTIGVVRIAGTNTLVDHNHVMRKHPSPDTCAPSDPRNPLPYECTADTGIFIANGPSVVSNNDVSDVVHGIEIAASDTTVTYNLVHSLAYTQVDDHPDGIISQNGADRVEVISNNVTLGSGITSTVAFFVEAETNPGDRVFDSWTVKDNWFHDGGDACMQPPDVTGTATNFQIINNSIGAVCVPGTAAHTHGWHNGLISGTGNVVSGNTWHDDGSPANS